MAEKTLYIVRHGETLFNVVGRTQGWCDSPLTKRGIEQCRRIGQAIAARGVRFDHAYSSSSERCCDTLEIVMSQAFGGALDYQREKDLRESNYGTWEGAHHTHDVFDLVFTPDYAAPPDGESGKESRLRFEHKLSEIMARPDHHKVIVAASGGVSMQLYLAHRVQSDVDLHSFCNCMTYVYGWDAGEFFCRDVIIPDIADLANPGEQPLVMHIESLGL